MVKPVRGPKKDTRETARGGAGGRSSSKQGATTNAPKRSTAGSKVWQYRLWSFQGRDTKLERFLAKNQRSQMKSLNFANWYNGEVS